VVIGSGEVIDDDLYVGATEFILEGTVNGDLIAFAQTVTINGTINGDLISAGQTLIVNGHVAGTIRMAGSVLFVGDQAYIGEDIVSAGYSLEVRKGSAIGKDLVFAGGQLLLAGNVAIRIARYGGRGCKSRARRDDPGGWTLADHVHATVCDFGSDSQTGLAA
jgi:cytoskeletal protein CcmA (bactofilin family)